MDLTTLTYCVTNLAKKESFWHMMFALDDWFKWFCFIVEVVPIIIILYYAITGKGEK